MKGLKQLIKEPVEELTIDKLKNYLTDIFAKQIDKFSRDLTALTGKGGAIMHLEASMGRPLTQAEQDYLPEGAYIIDRTGIKYIGYGN